MERDYLFYRQQATLEVSQTSKQCVTVHHKLGSHSYRFGRIRKINVRFGVDSGGVFGTTRNLRFRRLTERVRTPKVGIEGGECYDKGSP